MKYQEYRDRARWNQWEGYVYQSQDGTYTVDRACKGDGGWWVAKTDDNHEILVHQSWLEQDAVKQNWAGK